MRQLQMSVERWRGMDDRVLVLIWTEDSQIFRAELPDTWLPGTEVEANEVLNKAIGQPIPNDHLLPPWSDTLTEAKPPHSPDVYVKMRYPDLIDYAGAPIHERFMADVQALEIISKRPHPNVNKYFGCIRNGDAIGGICLEKLECTLTDLVQGKIPADQAPPFQPDVIISGIKGGIEHIHSFNLVHGDINPHNIMVDKAGNPVIIDFDSCVAVGSRSPGQGTPGWDQIHRDFPGRDAVFENDTYAFDLVVKFIRGEYDGQDFGFDDDDFDSEERQEEKDQEIETEAVSALSPQPGEGVSPIPN